MGMEAGSSIGIVVNGEAREARADTTVEEFLREHDVDSALVVVEHNGAILERADFTAPLRPGDRLEIVHFVGGG